MKKAKYELEKEVEKLASKVVNAKKQRKIINELFTEHNIPVSVSSDILSLKRSPSTENPYVLYHLLKKLNEKIVVDYFTDKEIKEYEETVLEPDKAKFPLTFKVVQIEEDQWIGRITMKEIMALSNSQLINYNENAQRVLKRIVRGGEEFFRIQLNKRAVEAIKESLLLDRYIPNTITLNIPKDDESRFVFDEDNSEMTIKKLRMFDILDGYHRYIAMCNVFVQNPDFDKVFELRLTNFTDEKARQFIWQEDQKTKMSKVDSEVLNKYNIGNKIVSRLKDYIDFIGRNAIINEGELCQGINSILVKPQKVYSNSEIATVVAKIRKGINDIADSGSEIFDQPVDVRTLYCMLIAFSCDETDINIIQNFTKDMIESDMISGKRELKVGEANKLKSIFEERRQSYVQ